MKEESLDRCVDSITLVETKALSQDRLRDKCFVKCGIWTLTLKEKQTESVCKGSAEVNICNNAGGKTGGSRMLHSEELHNLFGLGNAFRIFKSRRVLKSSSVA